MQQLFVRISQMMVVLIITFTLLAIPSGSAMAEMADANGPMTHEDIAVPQMAADLLVIRPLGLVATICGGAVYLLSLPFSAAGGNTKEVFQKTVAEPAAFTFKRPLGHDM